MGDPCNGFVLIVTSRNFKLLLSILTVLKESMF